MNSEQVSTLKEDDRILVKGYVRSISDIEKRVYVQIGSNLIGLPYRLLKKEEVK